MDPHTARCLQLSTSIGMPYHQQYRRNAVAAESMNRSRFPVKTGNQSRRPMPQRSASQPAIWMPTANVQQTIQPQSFTPSSATMTFSPQFYHDSPIAQTPAFDAPFYPMQNQDMDLSLKTDGLGMHFLDNDSEFSGITFSTTTDGFEDLVRLNDNEPQWLNTSPLSPDRHSISSASSGDPSSELPDLELSSSLHPQQEFINSIEMPILEEDISTTNFHQDRRARSMSRPPVARSSSNRRFRMTPYPVNHTRSSSVMSHRSAMSYQPTMSMPTTQCCTPVNECDDSFLFNNMHQDPFMEPHNPMEQFFSIEEPMIAPKPMHSYDNFLNSNFDDTVFDAPHPMVLPSSGMGHDACNVRGCNDHSEYADEPDLFGALSEEQSVPPEEDMKPEDPDMEPQEQEVRFEGDLYTPRFVRGHGNKREGYCGLCKPGRWLVLKNSAFWYDKSFTHGISAATGQPFDAPKETRRMSGNPDVWEGLCGTCDEWIALISNKKKGTTWFRHAYKCHNHQKSKEAPKKRRDTVSSRAQSRTRPIKEEMHVSSAAIKSEYSQHPQIGNGVQALQTISALI